MRRKTEKKLTIVLLIAILVILAINLGYNLNIIQPKKQKILESSQEFENAVKKATSAVVSITTNSEKSGSGSIISKDGHILTNFHVISEAVNITVTLPDKRIYPARLIGSDPAGDIALLKIDGENLPVIKIGNSDKLNIGEKVIAIGNPFNFDFTVTTGIISAKHRDRGPTEYRDFLQTDASINPGNSGGPLINLNGELIGVNTFIISGLRTGELGFAIPSNLAKKITEQLLKKGKVERGYLGVSLNEVTDFNEDGSGKFIPGALVVVLTPDGPSEKADIKVGDFIIEVNGVETENINQLRNQIAWLEPGSTVKVKVKRNETIKEFDVIMGLRPDQS